MGYREDFGNDRNEIYDRRDGKKKRRDWKERRHQEGRKNQQQRPVREYESDDDDETI